MDSYDRIEANEQTSLSDAINWTCNTSPGQFDLSYADLSKWNSAGTIFLLN